MDSRYTAYSIKAVFLNKNTLFVHLQAIEETKIHEFHLEFYQIVELYFTSPLFGSSFTIDGRFPSVSSPPLHGVHDLNPAYSYHFFLQGLSWQGDLSWQGCEEAYPCTKGRIAHLVGFMVKLVHPDLSSPLDTSARILLDLFQDLAPILLDLFEDLHHCSVVNDVAIDNKA